MDNKKLEGHNFPPDDLKFRNSFVGTNFEEECNQMLQYATILPLMESGNRPPPPSAASQPANPVIKPKPIRIHATQVQSQPLAKRIDPVGQETQKIRQSENSNSSFLTFQSLAIDKTLGKTLETSATSSGVQSEAHNYNTSDSNDSDRRKQDGEISNFRVFDDMAAQMKNALAQEIMHQVMKEQEKAQVKLDKQKLQFTKEMKRLQKYYKN